MGWWEIDERHVSEPRRVLSVGDVHARGAWMEVVCAQAHRLGCEAILQLGDFGFWPHEDDGRAYLEVVAELLERFELDCFFLDGNHDNLDALFSSELPAAGPFRRMGPRLYYVPRAARWTWQGISFLAMGGAHSIDKHWRLANEPAPRSWWWPEELIREADVRRALEGGPVDVLVAHDCPAGVDLGDFVLDEETERNRLVLKRIVDGTRPRLLLHGHWHRRASGWYRNSELGFATRVEGLDIERTYERNWLLLDLLALRKSLCQGE
jgi:calcineurin-like phosphoesterase family protein